MSPVFHIRVDHELGFFSFYDIPAKDYHDAEKEAEQQFLDDFCGGNNNSSVFPGVKYTLESFTFNKDGKPFKSK